MYPRKLDYTFSKLRELNPKIPQNQRALNYEHINTLYKNYDYKDSLFYNPIHIGILNKKYFLLDGQHRYFAFEKRYEDDGIDTDFQLNVYEFENEEDLHEKMVNLNEGVDFKPNKNFERQKIKTQVEKYFVDNFAKFLKKTDRPTRININLEKVFMILQNTEFYDLALKNNTKIAEILHEFNSYILKLDDGSLKKYHIYDKAQKYNLSSNKFSFGLYRKYEWIGFVIQKLNKKEYSDMDLTCETNKRMPIPKATRKNVWNKRFSKKKSGKCHCCKEKEIHKKNFECGHIISHFCGGSTHINNLEPICKTCNRDMSIMHMHMYMDLIQSQNK
jgi:hypothetical protein